MFAVSLVLPGVSASAAVKVSKGSSGEVASDSLDPVIAAQIAAVIAEDTNSAITNNVSQHADTMVVKSELGYDEVSDQYVKTDTSTNQTARSSIVVYTTVEGDNAQTVADKFGLSKDTIKWNNNLQADDIANGTELVILPVNGIMVKASASDTSDALAQKYKSSADAINSYNKLQDGKIQEGQEIIIPDGKKPSVVDEQAAKKATETKKVQTTNVSVSNLSSAGYAVSGSNTYAYGYCTWHAANRRAAIGKPIPNRWGNAISWAASARAAGYSVDGNPQAGDVLYHRYQGGAGHVAFVESVNEDGSILVSDMNYNGNWGRVTYRTVSPGQFGQYLFIH